MHNTQQELTNIGYLRSLLERHGFRFSKSLGQNFIVNPSVCPRIAKEGGVTPETGVLEIGPGVGVLTRELCRNGKKVVAIELDKRLPEILAETLADFNNVKILSGDAMEMDLHKVIKTHFPNMEVVVCANLPYYITSPMIMKLLEEKLPVKSITVMVQKEAAQRLCAPMPSRQSGAITAAVAYYTQPKILFPVSRGSFMPSPEVDSAVIRLDVREAPGVKVYDETRFFKVIKAAFSQRRKTILNCLSSGLFIDKETAGKILEAAQVSKSSRAEQLTLEDFERIANQEKFSC